MPLVEEGSSLFTWLDLLVPVLAMHQLEEDLEHVTVIKGERQWKGFESLTTGSTGVRWIQRGFIFWCI